MLAGPLSEDAAINASIVFAVIAQATKTCSALRPWLGTTPVTETSATGSDHHQTDHHQQLNMPQNGVSRLPAV